MKVLITNPPWPGPGFGARSDVRWPHRRSDKYLVYPIYLAYVVGILKHANIDVHFIDAVADELSIKAFVDKTKQLEPDLIAMECSTPSIIKDLETAKKLKAALNDTFIVLMGSHPTYFHEEILSENPHIDAIARGEFDYTIKDISMAISKGRKNLQEVKGISYREGDTIHVNEDRPLIQDLDSVPFPDRSLVKSKSYREAVFTGKQSTTIVTSRGCPYGCIFCLWPRTMYGRKFRARSAKNVVDEIEHVVNHHGVDEIYFDDDTFNFDRQRTIDICNGIINRGIKVLWMPQCRVDKVDLELLRLMKKAGCHYIKYGVESGSPEMLKSMKKGITKEDARNAFQLTRKVGIKTQAFFLLGLPGETHETVQMSIDFAKELKPDSAQFAVVIPNPGTELFDQCQTKGWLRYDTWEDFDCRKALIETENFSVDDVEKSRTEAYKKFYLRPSYILKTTLKMWNPKEAKRIINSAKSVLERMSYYGES